MKKVLSILLLSSLFFSSCSIDWNNEKEQKIAELEEKISELERSLSPIIFERQKECLSYKEEMQGVIDDLLRIGREQQEIYGRDDYIHNETLIDIFYSPVKNSCLYGVGVEEEYLEDGIIAKGICTSYHIRDFLSANQREIIETISGGWKEIEGKTTKACDNFNVDQRYLEKIEELK